jgi:glycosyltransferase involved in cell wall biosynthesis
VLAVKAELMLPQSTLFLVWGPPSHGPRSQVFARELGIKELHFLRSLKGRGALYAPVKYAHQAVQTLALLFRKRPSVVFVQSPPSLATLFVCIYCVLTGSRYVVDAHSAAFSPLWTRPAWLHQLLARRAVTTIVTNHYFQDLIRQWGGRAFVLHDIPTSFSRSEAYPVSGEFNIAVINSFAPDEPLSQILEAAGSLKDIQFYATGMKKNAERGLLEKAPANVHFTDFLPNEQYYSLLDSCHAILCLTTRDHTMQRGACEALWLGKPVITSDWPLLQEYFCQGTVHVDNTPVGIEKGVLDMRGNYQRYLSEIENLQSARREEWKEKMDLLDEMLQPGAQKERGQDHAI